MFGNFDFDNQSRIWPYLELSTLKSPAFASQLCPSTLNGLDSYPSAFPPSADCPQWIDAAAGVPLLAFFQPKEGCCLIGGWLLHTVGCGTLAAVSQQILLDPHVLGVWNIVVGWPIFKSPGRIIYLLAEGVISPLQSASLLLLLCLFPFLVSLCPLPFPSQLLAFLSLLFSVLFPLFAAPHHVHPLQYLLKVEEPTRAPLLLLLLPAIIWGNKDLRSAQMLLVDLTLTRKDHKSFTSLSYPSSTNCKQSFGVHVCTRFIIVFSQWFSLWQSQLIDTNQNVPINEKCVSLPLLAFGFTYSSHKINVFYFLFHSKVWVILPMKCFFSARTEGRSLKET